MVARRIKGNSYLLKGTVFKVYDRTEGLQTSSLQNIVILLSYTPSGHQFCGELA